MNVQLEDVERRRNDLISRLSIRLVLNRQNVDTNSFVKECKMTPRLSLLNVSL